MTRNELRLLFLGTMSVALVTYLVSNKAYSAQSGPSWNNILVSPIRAPVMKRTDPAKRISPDRMTVIRAFLKKQGRVEGVRYLLSTDDQATAVMYRRAGDVRSGYLVFVAQGSDITRLPPLPAGMEVLQEPVWRPDSSAIALVAQSQPEDGQPNGALFLYDIARQRLTLLAKLPAAIPYYSSWDRTGNVLAVLATDEEHIGDRMHGNAFLADNKGDLLQLTQGFNAVSPAWSPFAEILAVGDETPEQPRITFFDSTGRRLEEIDLRRHLTISFYDLDRRDLRVPPTTVHRDAQLRRIQWIGKHSLRVQLTIFDGTRDVKQWWVTINARK